jgi:proteasome lid subunit RPN8/RPN11
MGKRVESVKDGPQYYIQKAPKTIKISNLAHKKMLDMSRAVDSEVGGMLVCTISEDEISIDDLLIPEQTVSGASVDIDSDKLSEFVTPLAESDPELFSRIRGWWHSHCNMEPFWSGTDTNNIKDMLKDFSTLISVVSNVHGAMTVRLDLKAQSECGEVIITIDNMEPEFETATESNPWVEEQKAKIKDTVSKYDYTKKKWSDDDELTGYYSLDSISLMTYEDVIEKNPNMKHKKRQKLINNLLDTQKKKRPFGAFGQKEPKTEEEFSKYGY